MKAQSLEELLQTCPVNQIIGDNLVRAWSKINSPKYKKIVCSISGGSDSDVMLDIVWRCDKDNKVEYVWFDTGLEYQATKDHLKYLENKYGIKIIPYKAIKPIPSTCKQYGQPFLSKQVSEMIRRLQSHNFMFEDKSFEELYKEYPRCKSALLWWCNLKPGKRNNISWNKWLKEFMIENPPNFPISSFCCQKSKKDVSHKVISEMNCDLSIIGVRKAEGGARATAYKNCYSQKDGETDEYRPIFWYTNEDKRCYEEHYGIVHSRCYTEYGMKRTGCCGCPCGRNIDFELEVLKEHEPNLYKAVCNVFHDSFEYTKRYKDFQKEMNRKQKSSYQMTIDDFLK